MKQKRLALRPLLALLSPLMLLLSSHAAADPNDSYALDSIVREIPRGEPFACPKVDLVEYRGKTIKYSSLALVFKDFQPRLERFEEVVSDVATEVYGRPPTRVVHLGAYVCRRMTAYPTWLSEHSLGNALDVSGFNFGALPKDASLPEGLPKDFKNGFEVRVDKHWGKKQGHAAIHARFLRTLAERLIVRKDVFRVLLGPGYPAHSNHFHFDMSPYRMVEIYDEGKNLGASP